jgi:hypothetical protein
MSQLGRTAIVHCNGVFTQEEVDENLPGLNSGWLILADSPLIHDLAFLTAVQGLSGISIFDCPQVADVSIIGQLGLREVYLNGLRGDVTSADIATVAINWTTVQELGLPLRSLAGLEDFPPNRAVTRVLLYGVSDYRRTDLLLQAFPGLESLYLGIEEDSGVLDLTVLSDAEVRVDISPYGERLEIVGREMLHPSDDEPGEE